MREEAAPRLKKGVFASIFVLLALFFCSCLGEVAVRVATYYLHSFKSAPFRQYDPVLGVSLIPNKRVLDSRGCFAGEVVTNRWGMRDRDRSLDRAQGNFG